MILNGIVIPDLHCINQFEHNNLISSTGNTLEGKPIYWYSKNHRRKLDFVADAHHHKIKYKTYMQLYELLTQTDPMVLIWGEGTHYVFLRNYEPPAISALPLFEKHHFEDDDIFHTLTIKLEIIT